MDHVFKFLNCCVPYYERHEFWGAVVNNGLLDDHSLIMEGDLNIVLSTREIWGPYSRIDPLVDFFSHLFNGSKFVDVELGA